MVSREEMRQRFAASGKKLPFQQYAGMMLELYGPVTHEMRTYAPPPLNDFSLFFRQPSPSVKLQSIDDLLERDDQREADGFPRKILIGRIVRPGKGGKNRVVVVPSTTEDKFYHDDSTDEFEDDPDHDAGSGEGEEGDVIGEQPIFGEGEEEGPGGEGGAEHDIEHKAYEIGKIISEKFKLPHIKDKGKKRFLKKYTFDLTDRLRGSGQLLDKKATLRQIIETNMGLGRINGSNQVDPANLIVGPNDKVYRVLSQEKDYDSAALVFFVRDYSGSMFGDPTQVVVTQHLFIYAWLNYQYNKLVEKRFVLHDFDAKEVPDFKTYYGLQVGGGTNVASGFQLVNDIVEQENLAKDYNIYVCYGTDGDDWSQDGADMLPELEHMFSYVNRVGITVVRRGWGGDKPTTVEQYIQDSGFLEDYSQQLRMDVLDTSASEERIMQGIVTLFSEDEA